jgi:hypothetical protein
MMHDKRFEQSVTEIETSVSGRHQRGYFAVYQTFIHKDAMMNMFATRDKFQLTRLRSGGFPNRPSGFSRKALSRTPKHALRRVSRQVANRSTSVSR